MLSGIPSSGGVTARKVKEIVDDAVIGASEQQIVKDEEQDSSIALLELAQTAQQQLNVQLQSELMLRRLISDSYSIGDTDTAISDALVPYRLIADSYSIAQTNGAITTSLVPYRTIADSYSIATADATFAPRNRLRSTGSVQDQIIVNNNDIQYKINNINLLIQTATENTFFFPIRLSGAALVPTANDAVSRQYVDDAVAAGGGVPTRILAVGQLYEAYADNTSVNIAYNAFNIATFQDTQIIFYQPVFVSGAAATITDPMQLTSKEYVDTFITTTSGLSNYYTKGQTDVAIGLARKIISDNQLVQAEANDTNILISFNSLTVAEFAQYQITFRQPVFASAGALSLYHPEQFVYKGYVDSLNADMLDLLVGYRTIADSYSTAQTDAAITSALVPYRTVADSYSQSEVDALVAGAGGGGFTDRIQSTNGNVLQVDTSKLVFEMGGTEKMRVQATSISIDVPMVLQGAAATITGAGQVVPKDWVEAHFYDKTYIDALPSNLSTVYSLVMTTVTSGTDYVITHGLNTALENLLVELTLEIKTADSTVPMAVGDRFKIQYDNYNGQSPQTGYGVAIKSTGVNSILLATQMDATLVSFFANESTGDPAYSPIEWSRVKLHIHISTRSTTSYQLVDFSGYVPTNIQGSNPATAITQYTGNVLTSTATSTTLTTTSGTGNLGLDSANTISVQATNDLSLTSQTGRLDVYALNGIDIDTRGTMEIKLSEPGVPPVFRVRGSQPTQDEYNFQVNGSLGTASFLMSNVPLMRMTMTSGVFFEVNHTAGTGKLNGDFTVETLIETAPSSFEYKEYSYCVAKETAPSFCDIKKGVPQCNGYEQYHPRSVNLPRLIKFRYSEAFCKAMGKGQAYIDTREYREGWLWEDVYASYPELCTTKESVNKETGIAYTQKLLNVKGLQQMLIDALIEKVMRLEYAVSQITGESKMW